MSKYKFIKQFDSNDYSEGAEILEVESVYDGAYKPLGWVWTVKECSESRFSNHFQLVEVQAMRFNSNKAPYSLLDLEALEDTVKVLQFGAMKYSRDNWKKGFPFSTILDSMMRHIKGLQSGEWLDPESGLPHIGHIGCNAMFLGSKTNTMDFETLKSEFELWKKN